MGGGGSRPARASGLTSCTSRGSARRIGVIGAATAAMAATVPHQWHARRRQRHRKPRCRQPAYVRSLILSCSPPLRAPASSKSQWTSALPTTGVRLVPTPRSVFPRNGCVWLHHSMPRSRSKARCRDLESYHPRRGELTPPAAGVVHTATLNHAAAAAAITPASRLPRPPPSVSVAAVATAVAPSAPPPSSFAVQQGRHALPRRGGRKRSRARGQGANGQMAAIRGGGGEGVGGSGCGGIGGGGGVSTTRQWRESGIHQ